MKKRFVYLSDLSEEERAKLTPIPTPWPLRFESLSFGVRCFNTLRSSVKLSHSQFMPDSKLLGPSPRWSAPCLPGKCGNSHLIIQAIPRQACRNNRQQFTNQQRATS
ncbi:hypothetical protein [Solilutibacter pythonis]|uniref:hypothetical protein n=1 Tax=Solilutibacter pythonis TaxID=2483112 RepID=UPI0011C36C91|nr:hypothetical protein [Lysobacter pythonis]